MTYINATQDAGRRFFQQDISGPVVMLNLLRFREQADYTAFPDLDPGRAISGKEAYQLYIDHTLPFLREVGAEVIFSGQGGHLLIGPEAEQWDTVLLVRHQSKEAFLGFANNKGYLAGAGHRTAALADSRLLPIQE